LNILNKFNDDIYMIFLLGFLLHALEDLNQIPYY
jgi:hypothetical protein